MTLKIVKGSVAHTARNASPLTDDRNATPAGGSILRAFRRAVGRSLIVPQAGARPTDAPAAPEHHPGRHYQLPAHLAAAAQADTEKEAKRKAGLVTFGGAGAGYDRFGAAFQASGIAAPNEPSAAATCPDGSAPACDSSDLPARFSRRGKLGLAMITVFATIALAGVVTSTSAPATEAASAQQSLATSRGTSGPASPEAMSGNTAFGSPASEAAQSGTTASDALATSRQSPQSAEGNTPPQAVATSADPVTSTPGSGDTTGAAQTNPDNAEIAAYPSFSAGAPTGTATAASSTNAAGLNDRPAFGGTSGGYSGGAIPGATRFAATTVTAATPPAAPPATAPTPAPTPAPTALPVSDPSGTGVQQIPNTPVAPSDPSVPTAPPTGNPTTTPATGAQTSPATGGIAPPAGPLTIADLTVQTGSGPSQPPDLTIPAPVAPSCCTLTQVVTTTQQVDVPEPASLVLLAASLAASLATSRWGRRRR